MENETRAKALNAEAQAVGSSLSNDTKHFNDYHVCPISLGFDSQTASTTQLADHFERMGLFGYRDTLEEHRIDGSLASLLTDGDLRDMGIVCVGDRLRIRSILDKLKRRERMRDRNDVLWEGEERIYFTDCERLCITCGGCCPDDPSTYALTSTHLKVKNVFPLRICRLRLPCCLEYKVDNIDLSTVDGVDVIGIPAPSCMRVFCCADGKEWVDLHRVRRRDGQGTASGVNRIVLQQGAGEKVSDLIRNQVAEVQVMERY
mmetsp:Transcript_9516/g.28569  ORF Transcript_9516/g.28569 Transcript_9516/m.28569 type:complete len:260 (-) Transcript_9516:389-1168(-)